MTEQTQQTTELAIGETPRAMTIGDMFQSITELARDPNVDPGKMQAIIQLQEHMMDRQAKSEFQSAMHKARAAMPRITKDGKITNKAGDVQSRYAHYEAIDKIVRPIIEECGLTYGFDFREGEQGRVLVTCIVSHVGGHEERFGPMPLSIDTTGAKNATQGAGSAGKYGQRYTLCAAFNIVTTGEDDDGNMGRGNASPSEQWQALIEAGRIAATRGTASYESFYKSRTNMERGYLVDQGHHEDLKKAARAHD